MILKSLSATGADFTPMLGNLLRRLGLLAAMAGPVVFGLSNVPRISAQTPPTAATASPAFEVASIKPNRSGDHAIGSCFSPAGSMPPARR